MLTQQQTQLRVQLAEMLNPHRECCTCWTVKRNQEYVLKQQTQATENNIRFMQSQSTLRHMQESLQTGNLQRRAPKIEIAVDEESSSSDLASEESH